MIAWSSRDDSSDSYITSATIGESARQIQGLPAHFDVFDDNFCCRAADDLWPIGEDVERGSSHKAQKFIESIERTQKDST
jgi:hypothetical protein